MRTLPQSLALGPQVVQVGPPDAKQTCDVGDRTTFDLVDWNNDGRVDLVLGGLDGKVHVLLNEATAGSPDYRSDTILLDGANPLTVASGRASVTVVDLNDDGRRNLVLGNTEGQLAFYPNVGTDATPLFDGSQLLEADGAVIDLAGIPRSRPFVTDVNGDGVPDLLVGAGDGLVRQYFGSARRVGAGAPADPTRTDSASSRRRPRTPGNAPSSAGRQPRRPDHAAGRLDRDQLSERQRTGGAACAAHSRSRRRPISTAPAISMSRP